MIRRPSSSIRHDSASAGWSSRSSSKAVSDSNSWAMTAALPEETRTRMFGDIPAGRFGGADEIAAAVVYLASEEAAYVTGQVLNVSGGLYI